MLQIVIHGRGGQGAQTAGEILATAFFWEGKHVQTYATYGGARRGTPVSAFVRVDDAPIRLRCDIENPDVILCFDASLMTTPLLRIAGAGTLLLVNAVDSSNVPAAWDDFGVLTVDALSIARVHGLGRIINSSLIGALAGLIKSPDLNTLTRVLRERSPAKTEENVRALGEGYHVILQREGKNEEHT